MRFVLLSLLLSMSCLLISRAEEDRVFKSKEKRQLFYPGTKWCGAGKRARHYHDLGHNRKADICCRSHDKCKYTIPAFHKKWNLLNLRPSTMSHCGCDDDFYKCLKRAKTAAASNVGKIFFNVLDAKCFKFKIRKVCVKRGWFFKCKKYRSYIIAIKYLNKKF